MTQGQAVLSRSSAATMGLSTLAVAALCLAGPICQRPWSWAQELQRHGGATVEEHIPWKHVKGGGWRIEWRSARVPVTHTDGSRSAGSRRVLRWHGEWTVPAGQKGGWAQVPAEVGWDAFTRRVCSRHEPFKGWPNTGEVLWTRITYELPGPWRFGCSSGLDEIAYRVWCEGAVCEAWVAAKVASLHPPATE